MKAVILAGGQGSRLRPMTEKLPKPMVPILSRPIMEHIVRHLSRHGIKEILTTLHYRPRTIRNHFGDGSDFGMQMEYTLETEPLGTAGSVKLGENYLGEAFLVVAGDALTDFDFGAFMEFHRQKQAKVSLCLKRVPDPGEFGIVITDKAGKVQRFLEKPGPSEVFSDTVNTGVYLIEPEVLAQIPEGVPYDFAGDLFPALLEQGEPIYGYIADGYWSDIGTLEQLRQAHWDMLDGKVRLLIDGNQIQEKVWVGENTEIASNAVITPPCWLGDNVQVRSGARLGPYAVISDNVELDSRASISRGIVMRNSFIGEASDLRNCMVGPNNVIEALCEIGEEAVIGSNCHLHKGVIILPSVLVWPDKEIDNNTTVGENLIWESLLRPSIFGSRGVAGLGNLHITPEFAAALGKAFGTWVKRGRRVAVGRDRHPFSRLIKRALVSGLMAVGVDVDDLEESSIPETRFIAGYGANLSGGVHVRISEEHASVASIELFNEEGLPLKRSARRKIEAAFHRADFPRVSIDGVGTLTYPGRVYARYLDHLLNYLDRSALANLKNKVLYYCTEGNTARLLNEIFGSSGLPHLRANGLPANTLTELRKQVADIAHLNHAIGILIERHAEQLSLIDENGGILGPQRALELLTGAFIRFGPPGEPVFLEPDHPAFLSQLAHQHNRQAIVTRKEPASRLEEARQGTRPDEGWREFTHYYLGFDAVVGALNLLQCLSRHQLTLYEFEREIPVSHRHALILPCPWDQMGRVMRTLAQMKEAQLGMAPEGVRLHFEKGWVFVLPSADTPHIEVTVETPEATLLAEFVEEVNYRLLGLIK